MFRVPLRSICASLLLLCSTSDGREWHSADGSKTLEAAFVGLKDERVVLQRPDGKQTLLSIHALSAGDQAFAKLAQVALHGADVLGPQTFEITTLVENGAIARLGMQLSGPQSPWVFSGETFFLPGARQGLEKGDRFDSKRLYYAGNRTFQPLEGDPSILRAFDLTLDAAVEAELRIRAVAGQDPAKLAPIVTEPRLEIVSTRGLALPVGKGFYITEADLVTGAATLVLHEGGKDVPAKVIKTDAKLGLALLSCPVDLPPLRLLSRQGAQLGQNIFTISLSLTSVRKNLGAPLLTKGIVSKATSTTVFEHDASIDDNAVGGLVFTEKWEPLGVFFRSRSRSETPLSKTTPKETPLTPVSRVCWRSEVFEKLLSDEAKPEPHRLPGVPALKAGSLGDSPATVIEALRQSTALVVATREITHAVPARAPAAAGGAAPAGAAAAFSLSGSGTRHRSGCRFFNAAKPCQANEGTPCKICGG